MRVGDGLNGCWGWIKWVLGIKEGTWDERPVLDIDVESLNSLLELVLHCRLNGI